MSCDASEQFIEALQQPAAYDHHAEDIQLLETHISWVFLAGSYAYKIKSRSISDLLISQRSKNESFIVRKNCG